MSDLPVERMTKLAQFLRRMETESASCTHDDVLRLVRMARRLREALEDHRTCTDEEGEEYNDDKVIAALDYDGTE